MTIEKIKIGLFGFGRTGKIVAGEILKDDRFKLSWVVRKTRKDNKKYASNLLGYKFKRGLILSIDDLNNLFLSIHKVDVIIDFSHSSAVNYYKQLANHKTKIISAVSNYDKTDLAELISLGKKTAVIHSPNITLGINFLMIISKILQKIVPWADIEIVEEHFKDKKDVSGTALKIANVLGLDVHKHVNSIRVGGIIGKHEIIFGMPYQTIRLIHESISRAAFGQGAIYVANWIVDKVNGVYTIENIMIESLREILLSDEIITI